MQVRQAAKKKINLYAKRHDYDKKKKKRQKEKHRQARLHRRGISSPNAPNIVDLNSEIYFVATKKQQQEQDNNSPNSNNLLCIPTLEASISAPESNSRKQSQDISEFLNDWEIKQVSLIALFMKCI